jgi:hypothetical protein
MYIDFRYQQSDGHALDAVVGDGEHPVIRPQLRLVVHLHHGGQARPEYVRICTGLNYAHHD